MPDRKKKPASARVPATVRLGFPSLATLEGDLGGGGYDTTVVAG
jgi:hypothetical protein